MEQTIETTMDISSIANLEITPPIIPVNNDVESIQELLSEFYGVSISDMKGKTRKREVVIARQLAIYFIKATTTLTLKAIGSNFGTRDHSTVIHSLETVQNLCDTDKKFLRQFLEIKKRIKYPVSNN
jgi:chromosomal replication initiator protein